MIDVETIVDGITSHTKVVIVVMLLLSAGMAAGLPSVEEEAQAGQWEFGADEDAALEYLQENFSAENETHAQIVIQDDNVLTRESLLELYDLQAEFEEDPTISETLSEEDAFLSIADIVATVAILEERADELETRADELEAEADELEKSAEQLESNAAALEAEQVELEERMGHLTAALESTIELQLEYEAADADEREYIDEEIESNWAHAVDEAGLDDEQVIIFETAGEEVRQHTSEGADSDSIETAIEQATVGVFENEFAALEDAGQDLEDRGEELEAQGEELEERSEELEADAGELATYEPTTEEQRETLESMSDEELEEILEELLAEDAERDAFMFLPTDFEAGSTSAEATTLFVSQSEEIAFMEIADSPEEIVESQERMIEIVDDRFGDDGYVYGFGIVTSEMETSLEGSMVIIVPLALLFVFTVLTVAYRDILDIILGFLGIALVLAWTYGFMGWTGIEVGQTMLVVPVLLIGLSIDYAIHVTMRQREERDEDPGLGPRNAMKIALAGLGVALVWVTITAMIGFLSNLTAPIDQTREFGVVTAFGIGATLLIFGVLLPAVKIELDERLEARGYDRRKRAFGTGGGRIGRTLLVGRTFARRAPLVLLLVVALVTAGGAYGASQVDTTFDNEEFIAAEVPEWAEGFPGMVDPDELTVKESIEVMNEHFLREGSQAQILITGDVTADDTLERVAEADAVAADQDEVFILANGERDVQSPLFVMERVAEQNDSFNDTFVEADTTGDGVPNENLTAVYDEFYEVEPDVAEGFVYRSADGEYEALRMSVSVHGDATPQQATEISDEVAAVLDGDGLEAIGTGSLIITDIIEGEMVDMVLESLFVSVIAIFLFATIAYRYVHGSATLGIITLLPVLLAIVWIFGTMYVLDFPINVITGTTATLTIGLGVAYNIHVSERYRLELEETGDVWEALEETLTGTGAALFGSALTTAGGFGVLAFTLLPQLQQFGIITATVILYAFLGSVLILPTLLVLWTRYLAPETVRDAAGLTETVESTGVEQHTD